MPSLPALTTMSTIKKHHQTAPNAFKALRVMVAFLILEDIWGAYSRQILNNNIPGRPGGWVNPRLTNYSHSFETVLCEPFRQIINFPLLFPFWLRKMVKFQRKNTGKSRIIKYYKRLTLTLSWICTSYTDTCTPSAGTRFQVLASCRFTLHLDMTFPHTSQSITISHR